MDPPGAGVAHHYTAEQGDYSHNTNPVTTAGTFGTGHCFLQSQDVSVSAEVVPQCQFFKDITRKYFFSFNSY